VVFVFVTSRVEVWGPLIAGVREGTPCPVEVVATAGHARARFQRPNVVGAAIDSELPDGNGYDLCGWLRARFRDLRLKMLDAMDLDTSARWLSEDGAKWTVPDAVRRRMTDTSVLNVTSEPIPMPSDATIAAEFGLSAEELEREQALMLEKTGFASMAELVHHVRNLPPDDLDAGLRVPAAADRTTPTPELTVVVAVTSRVETWRADLDTVASSVGCPIIVVPDGELAKRALADPDVGAMLIDPWLPDMSGYDLAGFARAHFRDLPLHILGDAQVDLAPLVAGESWTVHASLRARMTDLSVLTVTLDTIPVLPVRREAEAMGVTVEEVERSRTALLVESGFATFAELIHHLRNPPEGAPS
jgi:CheY-like chemotaxis protein